MKIKLLGTAASEGIPAMFCDCEKCRKARETGGKNIRTRTQAIVDDKLLIDFPADSFSHFLNNNIDLNQVNHCIITHAHSDHFYEKDFLNIWRGSHPPKDWDFHVYGNEDINVLAEMEQEDWSNRFFYHYVKPFEPFKAGDYEVVAFKAVHTTANPYFYSISDGEKSILYAQDTDFFSDESWEKLVEYGKVFDVVIMDCTQGSSMEMPYVGHMCIGVNDKLRNRLCELGLAHKETKFIVNHFSHNGEDILYEDLLPIAQKYDFDVSYDGMEIEV